jgi:hypothetical protein
VPPARWIKASATAHNVGPTPKCLRPLRYFRWLGHTRRTRHASGTSKMTLRRRSLAQFDRHHVAIHQGHEIVALQFAAPTFKAVSLAGESTSAVARLAASKAPFILPLQSEAVSVPAQCNNPIVARKGWPYPVQASSLLRPPRQNGSLPQLFSRYSSGSPACALPAGPPSVRARRRPRCRQCCLISCKNN